LLRRGSRRLSQIQSLFPNVPVVWRNLCHQRLQIWRFAKALILAEQKVGGYISLKNA